MFLKKNKETYLVCGLGNPGTQYENTRHNAGFLAMGVLEKAYSFSVNKVKNRALYGEATVEDKRVVFIMPQTYMNNSGEAVSAFARFYKVPTEHIIVISDDVTLEPGVLRIRKNGSEGGHNGLKSITALCGGNNYPRMRIGVGKKPDEMDLADWVLGKLSKDDLDKVLKAGEKIAKALPLMLEDDVDMAMSRFNG